MSVRAAAALVDSAVRPDQAATPPGDDSGSGHSAGDERPAPAGRRRPEQRKCVRSFLRREVAKELQTARLNPAKSASGRGGGLTKWRRSVQRYGELLFAR